MPPDEQATGYSGFALFLTGLVAAGAGFAVGSVVGLTAAESAGERRAEGKYRKGVSDEMKAAALAKKYEAQEKADRPAYEAQKAAKAKKKKRAA